MKNIIQFSITEEDGYYTAEGVNVPVVTQGKTFEELRVNILEATELLFEGEDFHKMGFGDSPSILTNLEIFPRLHGVNA